MKKILIFSLAYYPHNVSGAETAIREITDRIDDIEFHMVTLRYNNQLPKIEKIGNVLIHRIGLSAKNPSLQDLGKLPLDLNKPLYQFLAPLKGWRLHSQYKYDGVWAMMAHSTGVPAAIFNILSPQTKYLLTLQEGDPIEYIEKTLKPLWPLFTRSFKKATLVQAISGYLADWAKHRGVKEENIAIISNGANPRDMADDFSEDELNKLRSKLNKKPNEIYLINTARLVKQKANDITIKSLTKLPANIKLLLVGDGPEKNSLQNLTKRLALTNRVIFVGQVDRSEVSLYRKISDIFVCPSLSEGLGNAFLSAMAAGLPVIATRAGGLKEFILADKTAWIVDKNNPDQIAQTVLAIINNPAKTKSIAAYAKQMIHQKYNWDNIAQQMRQEVFSKIV